jgi:uncharacterized SAM-binding protein YcdF (DUF218 family)
MLLLAIGWTSCNSRFSKKSYEQAKKGKPYDVIIVPGVPYNRGVINNVMKMRVLWAKHLYDSGFAKNIIFSGSSVYSPYVEGVVMKIMADSLGIPSDKTFSETKAEHSTENIYYSWKMAKAMGFKKIALATDPFQAGTLRRFIKKYCPDMQPIPIIMGTLDLNHRVLPGINDSSAFVKDFVSITERETFWQRLKGTRGLKIKEEVEAEAKNK